MGTFESKDYFKTKENREVYKVQIIWEKDQKDRLNSLKLENFMLKDFHIKMNSMVLIWMEN